VLVIADGRSEARSRNTCIASVFTYGMTSAKALSVPGSTAAKM